MGERREPIRVWLSDDEAELVPWAYRDVLRDRGIDPEQPYDTLTTDDGIILVQPSQPFVAHSGREQE